MITELFCNIDDFCLNFSKFWNQKLIESEPKKRIRHKTFTMSEIMTITVYFHMSDYRTFKHYYKEHVCNNLKDCFPNLVSYNRFVELMQGVLVPLTFYMQQCRLAKPTGISFIDGTKITVCHNRRIPRHKMFEGIAKRGKDSVGWFYGFKLHLVVSDRGEILSWDLAAGNVDERNSKIMNKLTKGLYGKLFGDKGYISKKLAENLKEKDLELVTTNKKNMKKKILSLMDRILLRKRALIETVNDQLKNVCQIEHTRHRSFANFLVNLISGLISYTFKEKKPILTFTQKEVNMLKCLPVPV